MISKDVSPEYLEMAEKIKKWMESPIGKLEMEKCLLDIKRTAIIEFDDNHKAVMESREKLPFFLQPLDASYWYEKRPQGSIEEIDKLIAEINTKLEILKSANDNSGDDTN